MLVRMALVGREAEQQVLSDALASKEAELIAIYGRRRVGKTYLVREFFKDKVVYELTGSHGAPVREQLQNHARALGIAARLTPATPSDWSEAFQQLIRHLASRRVTPRVVFFDEVPWLASRRSGFLRALEHFWNTWASQQRGLVVIVCGSAAAWMISKLLHARGGLHNRVTHRIRLLPFTLAETRAFLEARSVKLSHYGIAELYMALGGVPHYLKGVRAGDSPAVAIERLCFSPEGPLREEFDDLYRSLFTHADDHMSIVRALATKASGMTREELLQKLGIKSGGGISGRLDELEQSGFLLRLSQFGRQAKDAVYRLSDEYSLFYLKWMEHRRGRESKGWLKLRSSAAWRAWSGVAFEALCIKHTLELKRALGIEGVSTNEYVFRHRERSTTDAGTQIDLVIDRADHCINLCEMKFSEVEFSIDKGYARELRQKADVFRRTTNTRKSLFITLVTTHGLLANENAKELVAAKLDLSALLRDRN
jgi:hypothetical protein